VAFKVTREQQDHAGQHGGHPRLKASAERRTAVDVISELEIDERVVTGGFRSPATAASRP